MFEELLSETTLHCRARLQVLAVLMVSVEYRNIIENIDFLGFYGYGLIITKRLV